MVNIAALEEQVNSNIFDNAMCLVISKNLLGSTKSMSTVAVEVDMDKSMLHASKDLFNSIEHKQIVGADTKLDEFIKSRCLPSFFKNAIYLVPFDLLDEVDTALVEHQAVREVLVEKFCAAYDRIVAEAKVRLKSQFNSADYPSVQRVRMKFGFQWQYFKIGQPPKLREINPEIWKREQQKTARQWTDALEEMKSLLRTQMSELLAHAIDKLTPNDAGVEKRRVFRTGMLDKMTDFINSFDPRNKVLDDSELQALVTKVRLLTNGVTPAMLKENEGLQASVKAEFDVIKAQLDTMIADAPRRSVRFED